MSNGDDPGVMWADSSPKVRLRSSLLAAFSVVLAVIGSACGIDSTSTDEASASTEPPASQTDSDGRQAVAEVSDLPTSRGAETPEVATYEAQSLLQSLGTPIEVDGVWGDATTQAFNDIRAYLGMEPGGLDAGLWTIVFTAPPPDDFAESSKPTIEGFSIPASAVHLPSLSPTGDLVVSRAHYTLPFAAEVPAVREWIAARYDGKSVGQWRWCESQPETLNRKVQYFWWQEPDRILSVVVSDLGGNRVDIDVSVEEGVPLEGCAGYG